MLLAVLDHQPKYRQLIDRRPRDRRQKAAPDIADLIINQCPMAASPEGIHSLIDLYFMTGKRPCGTCPVHCDKIKQRSIDRRRN